MDRQRGHSDRDPRCRGRARTSSCSARRPSETNHARQRQQPIREQDQPGAKWDSHLQITSSPKLQPSAHAYRAFGCFDPR